MRNLEFHISFGKIAMLSRKVHKHDPKALIPVRLFDTHFNKALRSNIVSVPFALAVQIAFGSVGDKLNPAGIQVNGTEASSRPVAISQTLIVRSFEAEMRNRPSGENPQALTDPLCPVPTRSSRPRAAFRSTLTLTGRTPASEKTIEQLTTLNGN
jgi:hypothetical protein